MEFGVTFDESTKIWSRPSKDHGIPVNTLVGPEILKNLKEMDENRVIEFNHANGKSTTAKEMYNLSVTCAKNLESLGVKKGDIVTVVANLTYYTTPLCYGCFIHGAVVNPVPVTSTDGEHVFFYIHLSVFETFFYF